MKINLINNNNTLLQLLLIDEEDNENYLCYINMLNKPRKPIRNMFLSRENEGFFEVLVNRHLTNNYNSCCDTVQSTRIFLSRSAYQLPIAKSFVHAATSTSSWC